MIILWLNNYISTELFLKEEILKIGWSLFTITEISFHRTHNGDWEYRKDICTLLDLLVYEFV